MSDRTRTYYIVHEQGKHPQVFCTKPIYATNFIRVLAFEEHQRVTERIRKDLESAHGMIQALKQALRKREGT